MTVAELMDELTHLLSDHEQKRADWRQLVSELGQAKVRIAALEAERDAWRRTEDEYNKRITRDEELLAASRERVARHVWNHISNICPVCGCQQDEGKCANCIERDLAAARERIAELLETQAEYDKKITRDEERIAALEAERDKWKSAYLNETPDDKLAAARARIAALEAERDRLRGSLERLRRKMLDRRDMVMVAEIDADLALNSNETSVQARAALAGEEKP
jgi:chromosome segregation ATPase